MSTITVEARVVGQKRPLFADYHVPVPPELLDSGRIRLRDLISSIVHKEVREYYQRQQDRRLVRVLTPRAIEEGSARGKIDAGEHELSCQADEHSAVDTALQAFEDGLYYVFIDDVQQESLEQTVFVGGESRIMFLRLVALAGG